MSKLKFELQFFTDKEPGGSYFSWVELHGYNEDNPDDCPVLIRADSLEELREYVDSTLEVFTVDGINRLSAKTVILFD